MKFDPQIFRDAGFTFGVTDMAMAAQKAFDEWISDQPITYGGIRAGEWQTQFVDITHQARLVCIEPIPSGDDAA